MRNCCNVSARPFVLDDKKLLSHEGITEGDSAAMAVYGIALTPLLKHLATCYCERNPRTVAFADDLSSTGKLLKLCSWWKGFLDVSPKYGYFPKTILIISRKS